MSKAGKWEEREFKNPVFSSSYTPLSGEFRIVTGCFCSKCDTMVPGAIFYGYKYCPYCGDRKERSK